VRFSKNGAHRRRLQRLDAANVKSGQRSCVFSGWAEPFLPIEARETTAGSSRARVVLRLINQEGLQQAWVSLP